MYFENIEESSRFIFSVFFPRENQSNPWKPIFALFLVFFTGVNNFSRVVFQNNSRVGSSFHGYFLRFFHGLKWIFTGRKLIIFHGRDIFFTGYNLLWRTTWNVRQIPLAKGLKLWNFYHVLTHFFTCFALWQLCLPLLQVFRKFFAVY